MRADTVSAAEPKTPLFDEYQKRVIRLALKYRVLAIEKSRRIGISWVLVFVACLRAMPNKKPVNVLDRKSVV